MLDDLKKSFSAMLYERTTSPFYGTLLLSWSVWNWKILYISFFISENKLINDKKQFVNKVDYIVANCNNEWNLVWFPLISTVVLITIVPIISNGAYWLSLIYNKWKIDKKNEVESKRLLTLEQSIELREEILEQETKFEKLLATKNLEIEQLKSLAQQSLTETSNSNSVKDKTQEEYKELAERIKNNPEHLIQYKDIISRIQNSNYANDSTRKNSDVIHLLESYDVIENPGSGIYKYTSKGKDFLKIMSK